MGQGLAQRRHRRWPQSRQRIHGASSGCGAVAGQGLARPCSQGGASAVGGSRQGIRSVHAAPQVRVGQPLKRGVAVAVDGAGIAWHGARRSCVRIAAMPAPHDVPQRTVGIPAGIAGVPARLLRLLHTVQQELHHVARPLGAVGGGAVPQLVVCNGHRTRAAGHQSHRGARRALRIVLAAGQHAGGSELVRCVLRVVEQQHLASAVIALAAAVLVHVLRLAARPVVMAVAVIVKQVTGPENAGQGAVHGRVGEHPRQVGNPRQQVVAGVWLGAEQCIGLPANRGVELLRQRRVHRHITVPDKLLHLPVRQQKPVLFVAVHRGPSTPHSAAPRPPAAIRCAVRARSVALVAQSPERGKEFRLIRATERRRQQRLLGRRGKRFRSGVEPRRHFDAA